uniref:G-protein coupled receptors family 1 profile domain-containing protein n=1 Tax=Plectus sambesii TaxID=2011161 RepID=A0A914VT31_9BILA
MACTTDAQYNASAVSALSKVDLLYEHGIIGWPNFTHCLPHCGLCQAFLSEGPYITYNLVVIGFLLPVIGVFGLFGNAMSAFLYSRPVLRSSTNLYLCALGCSDCAVIVTALFLFFVDSVRRYSVTLTTMFGQLSPFLYPAGMAAQTCSVYFTMAAAIDCFAQVCLPQTVKQWISQPKLIMSTICFVIIFGIVYNIPHCFEAIVVECWHRKFLTETLEVCPDPFRFTPTYLVIYYKYMYTIFLAVGPLILLIILNSFIIIATILLKRRNAGGGADSGDTITLVLVVLLFIFCNVAALLLNIFESKLGEILGPDINYVVDGSNLMVVLNSSANFGIYYAFSGAFRDAFKHYACRARGSSEKLKTMRQVGGNTTLPVAAEGIALKTTHMTLANGHRRPLPSTSARRDQRVSLPVEHLALLIVDEPEVLI